MAPKTVPSKIVIAGNSKMSLNERFSSIPKARTHLKKPKFVPKTVYQNVEYEDPVEVFPRPVIRRPRPHPTFHQRPVPIQNRVTFVKTAPAQRGFAPRTNLVNRNPQFQTFKKPAVRSGFNQVKRKLFRQNVPISAEKENSR
ncbi:unnamed protein product [Caenorhabditis sp. 36 PRJEB53466]|nr:unnamed protein product [Caenorhabditis sp. 36 PRJEB53466]